MRSPSAEACVLLRFPRRARKRFVFFLLFAFYCDPNQFCQPVALRQLPVTPVIWFYFHAINCFKFGAGSGSNRTLPTAQPKSPADSEGALRTAAEPTDAARFNVAAGA